jgi:hypothetical protein
MIVHEVSLIIFLLVTIFIIAKQQYNILMFKVYILPFFLDILQLIINFLKIKINKYIHKIISNIYIPLKFKRKDHTPRRTSYNKS